LKERVLIITAASTSQVLGPAVPLLMIAGNYEVGVASNSITFPLNFVKIR
jgi:hypothetical protein